MNDTQSRGSSPSEDDRSKGGQYSHQTQGGSDDSSSGGSSSSGGTRGGTSGQHADTGKMGGEK